MGSPNLGLITTMAIGRNLVDYGDSVPLSRFADFYRDRANQTLNMKDVTQADIARDFPLLSADEANRRFKVAKDNANVILDYLDKQGGAGGKTLTTPAATPSNALAANPDAAASKTTGQTINRATRRPSGKIVYANLLDPNQDPNVTGG